MRLGVRFKVLLGVLVPQTVILGAFSYLLYVSHRDAMLETTTRTVREVGRLVEGSLQHVMLTADRANMASTVEQLVESTGIDGLMLLDAHGQVSFAPGRDTVGQVLLTTNRECVACHGPTGAEARPQTALVTLPNGERVVRSCRPIVNRTECHACHDPDQPYNGVLLIDVSTAAVDDHLARYAQFYLLVLAAAVVVSSGVVWATMDRTVVGPLERLTALARRITAGDVPEPVAVVSDDELGQLTRALNMTIAVTVDRMRLADRLQERTEELERLNHVLLEKEAARTFLLKETINAQEAERKRVARQLHDELAQSLTGLIMSLDAVEPLLAEEAGDLRAQLARTRALLAEALEQTRRLILDLRPTMLDDLGLVSALRWYAETHLKSTGAVVSFTTDGHMRRLGPELETALFRIGQEALNNVARHARARRVAVRLVWRPDAVVLGIEDDGQGFDLDAAPRYESGAGLGLMGMRERTEIIGGELTLESRPGGGTRVVVRLPADGDTARPPRAGEP